MNDIEKQSIQNIDKQKNNNYYKQNHHMKKALQTFSYSIQAPWKRMSNVRTSPSRSFGKSARIMTQKIQAPGPGTYNLNKTTFLKGYVSFKGTKDQKIYTQAPGPNLYQPIDLFTSKKYSFTRSQQKHRIQKSPSPAAYETNLKHKSQSISFTKASKEIVQKQKINNPGPGKYQIIDNTKESDYSFTHTKKFIQSNQEINEKAQIPGPGTYDLASFRKNIKTNKFSRTIRNFIQDSKVPGPGAYALQKSSLLSRGGVLSSEKRLFQYDNGIPGPGNYKQVDINLIKKSQIGVIINKSIQKNQKSMNPGPTDYNKQLKNKILGGVIGRQSRKNNPKIIQSAYNQLSKTTKPIQIDKLDQIFNKNKQIMIKSDI